AVEQRALQRAPVAGGEHVAPGVGRPVQRAVTERGGVCRRAVGGDQIGAHVAQIVEMGREEPGAKALLGALNPLAATLPEANAAVAVGPERDDTGRVVPAEEPLILQGGRNGGDHGRSCPDAGCGTGRGASATGQGSWAVIRRPAPSRPLSWAGRM